MPLINSYVIWNNKGGVGKTTLTFHLATQYAISHPRRKVLVIDLCPQANVSLALLSSPDALGTHKHVTDLCLQQKTISFYLQQFTTPQTRVLPREFLTHVSHFNNQISENVELLCGDKHLELVGRSLEHKRQADAVLLDSPWVLTTSSILYFIEGLADMQGATTDDNEWVVFIDTNPSFAVYTEIALAAAQRLIIPINADDFSRESIKTMLDLVYGIAANDVPLNFRDSRKRMFCYKAQLYKIRLPQIYLVINNRSTCYKVRSATAFDEMAQSSIAALSDAFRNHRECFVPMPSASVQTYLQNIEDFHTAGVLSLHTGCPLKDLKLKIQIFSQKVQLNRKQLDVYIDHLNTLVEKL